MAFVQSPKWLKRSEVGKDHEEISDVLDFRQRWVPVADQSMISSISRRLFVEKEVCGTDRSVLQRTILMLFKLFLALQTTLREANYIRLRRWKSATMRIASG